MAAFHAGSPQGNIAQINITPLVDVLLVLLVIFMIAAPVLTREISLDLPQTPPDRSRIEPPPAIELRIDAAGDITWNGSATPLSALPAMMSVEAQRARQPMLRIDASADADYGTVAKVLAAANNAQLRKIGFTR